MSLRCCRAAADFNASRCMCAFRAHSARLARSCGVSSPSGSTSRSNLSNAAFLACQVRAALSGVLAQDSYAPIRPRRLRISGLSSGAGIGERLGGIWDVEPSHSLRLVNLLMRNCTGTPTSGGPDR
jgi:hypothetical protein